MEQGFPMYQMLKFSGLLCFVDIYETFVRLRSSVECGHIFTHQHQECQLKWLLHYVSQCYLMPVHSYPRTCFAINKTVHSEEIFTEHKIGIFFFIYSKLFLLVISFHFHRLVNIASSLFPYFYCQETIK